MCRAEATPLATFLLTRTSADGQLQFLSNSTPRVTIDTSTDNQAVLTISPAQASDAGNYTCRAGNTRGSLMAESQVIVYGKNHNRN